MSEYRERPDMPRCPDCNKRNEVEPLADPHPWANWWCAGCDLAFSGTAAEAFRHKQRKLEEKAERHESTEALRRTRDER